MAAMMTKTMNICPQNGVFQLVTEQEASDMSIAQRREVASFIKSERVGKQF